MVKVISFKICPFVQRVTALLEAKHIPHEIEYIDLNNKPQWFLDISPTGQVPVLITESGVALFESDAIAEYADEIRDPLEVGLSSEQRAIDRAWSHQATKQYLVQCSAMRSSDEATLVERSEKLRKAFAKAEKELIGAPFFKGTAISNVDISWLPLLYRAAIIEKHTGYDFLDGFPRVKAWQTAMIETGLAKASVPRDFEKVFTSFYLSESTFLGRWNHKEQESNSECECLSGGCC